MDHVTVEKIILGLDERDLKHIEECKKCKELYDLMSIKVDERIIDVIDAKVKESVMLKFREMKMMGKFNKTERKSLFLDSLKYVVSFSMVVFLVVVGVIIWVISSNVSSSKIVDFYGSKIVLNHDYDKFKDVKFKSSDGTLEFVIPDYVKSLSLNILPSSEVKEVVVKYGNLEYKFAANNFKLDVREGKVFVNGNEAKVVQKVFKNVIYLNDGSEVVGNLLGIKENFIIFETSDGVKNFDRKDVKKIIYR